jgi:phenylpropionate dioxygenase-like ring-hydroxylating dioxygenase large terminal subunit
MIDFVRNAWFPIAYSSELRATPICHTAFSKQIVIFRGSDGAAAALDNRCCHKSAPLSLGKIVGNTIECPYHGLRYAVDGTCVHIPGQSHVPANARVQSYPTEDRYGLIWIWPGDPNLADPDRIYSFRHFGDPGWTVFHGPRLLFGTHISNILDNLVDPAHTSFVHSRTIGGRDAVEIPMTTEQKDGEIITGRWIENSEPVPIMRRYGNFPDKVDRWQVYHVIAPNISLVDMGAIAAGEDRSETNRDRSYRTFSCAALTPESDRSTHYFWFVMRNFAVGDVTVSAEMSQAYAETFEEDRELLGHIEELQRQADKPPVRLGIDAATVRLRRLIAAGLAAEQGQNAHGMLSGPTP